MHFDSNNHINQLCAKGMQLEGEGRPEEALRCYEQAWGEAADELERLTAAHYLARQQNSIADKLRWDEIALNAALKMDGEDIKSTYPSLYLNVAKCYEDLNEKDKAEVHYAAAQSFAAYLPDDGYGKMIKAGIAGGMVRMGR